MESVYFGKENTEAILHPDENKSGNNGNRNENLKEYYFPDESRVGFKILRLITALLLTGFLDFLVVGVGFSIYFAEASYDHPYMDHIEVTDMVLLWGIMLVYAIGCLIISPLFFGAGREKTYVRYGNTFYILNLPVRVRTNKGFFLMSKENAEKKIHYRYKKQIANIDRLIQKGKKIKKVLTDCSESDNVGAKEGTYTGYNEKKVRDEEFRIPSYYAKYDPEKKYCKANFLPIFFILIKAALYISVFMFYANNGKANYAIYQNKLDPYIEMKSGILEPLGFEYYDGNDYLLDQDITFVSVSDSHKRIKFYTALNSSKSVYDISVSIDFDMKYEEDLNLIYDLILKTAHVDLEGNTDLENDIEAFRNGDAVA